MTVPNAKRSLAMKGLRRSYRHIKRFALALRGQELWQGVQHRVSKVSLGNEGACWCVSPEGISESSVVYSVGVGEDISFDLDLIQRYRLRVHAFDPTPRSIGWVQSQVLPEEFVFHSYGVAGFDGTCLFSPASDPAYVSHTLLPRSTPWPAVELPVYRLATIMKMLGNTAIDVLKMDIEGAEAKALQGGQATIRHFRPRMAISCEHLPSDVKEIPQVVNTIQPGYQVRASDCYDFFSRVRPAVFHFRY